MRSEERFALAALAGRKKADALVDNMAKSDNRGNGGCREHLQRCPYPRLARQASAAGITERDAKDGPETGVQMILDVRDTGQAAVATRMRFATNQQGASGPAGAARQSCGRLAVYRELDDDMEL